MRPPRLAASFIAAACKAACLVARKIDFDFISTGSPPPLILARAPLGRLIRFK